MMLIKNIYASRSLPRLPLPVTCTLDLHKAVIPYYPMSSGYKKSKNDRAQKLSQLRCSVVGGWWLVVWQPSAVARAGYAAMTSVFVDSMTLAWSLLGSQSRLVGACGLTMSALVGKVGAFFGSARSFLSLWFCSFAELEIAQFNNNCLLEQIVQRSYGPVIDTL